jgi:hypothetical protein
MTNYWSTGFIPTVSGHENFNSFWDEPDSKENFKKNPKPEYTETSITYCCNSYGYRTPEFDVDSLAPSIFCLGCSFTYGIGVRQEETWPSLVQQRFPEYNVHNLGSAGSSGDTIVRTLTNIGKLLNPKILLILWPEVFRFELYKDTDIYHTSALDGICGPEMVIDSHFISLRRKNKAMIDMLSKQYNYSVIDYSTRSIPINFSDLGRDDHPGPKSHANIAELYINSIIKVL